MNMKRLILSLILVLAGMVAIAQNDTMYDRYDRYHYTKWYDECPQFYDSCTRFRMSTLGDVVATEVKEEYTPVPMKVKGLVAFVDKTSANEHSVYDYRLPEYMYLYQKIDDTLHLIDSLRWDTAAPKVMCWTRNPYTQDSDCCFAYEAYFSKPYMVDSVFAIGGSTYSNDNYWWEEMNDYWDLIYKHTRYVGMQEDTCWASMTHNCKPYGNLRYFDHGQWYDWTPHHYFRYGVYLAITDFYTLEVGSCDSTIGHVAGMGSGRYPEDAPVRIEAVADSGYHFTQWNDGNTDNPRIVMMTQDTVLIACFAMGVKRFDLDVRTENSLKGTVSGGGMYDSNQVATLTATANRHYRFDRWNDGDTANPRNIVVVSDSVFTAYFVSETSGEDTTQNAIRMAERMSVSIAPNPTSGRVRVSTDEPMRQVAVYDMAGKEVSVTVVDGQQPTADGEWSTDIDLADLPNGTYIVKVTTKTRTTTRKLIVE